MIPTNVMSFMKKVSAIKIFINLIKSNRMDMGEYMGRWGTIKRPQKINKDNQHSNY